MTLGKYLKNFFNDSGVRWRLVFIIVSVVIVIPILVSQDADKNWHIMFWYGIFLVLIAQWTSSAALYFRGEGALTWQQVVKRVFYGQDPRMEEVGVMTDGMFVPKRSLSQVPLQERESAAELNVYASNDIELREEERRASVGFKTLMPSAFISWIFAKSVRNAASLGHSYGYIGGVAYAGWYTAFFTAAFVGYRLRTSSWRWKSLNTAIQGHYGNWAVVAFSMALLYRLFNEVWSNSLVVASFYGPVHSDLWWTAVVFSTLIPLIYSVMGGMRSSLISDFFQCIMTIVLLVVTLAYVGDQMPGGFGETFRTKTDPTLEGGLDLLCVALLQGGISYAFFDPVLTDRTFLSTPRTMALSFTVAGFLAGLYIFFFSLIGVYAVAKGIPGEPANISASISTGVFYMVNIIILTSSMGTLDSCFTSTGKVLGLEVLGWIRPSVNPRTGEKHRGPLKPTDPNLDSVNVNVGRIGAIIIAFIGTLPLIADTNALDATTISGTIVLGLGPPMLLMAIWRQSWKQAPLAFHLPFWFGVIFGSLYQAKKLDNTTKLFVGQGGNKLLLGVNLYGAIIAFGLCFIGMIINQYLWIAGEVVDPTAEIPNKLSTAPDTAAAAAAEEEKSEI